MVHPATAKEAAVGIMTIDAVTYNEIRKDTYDRYVRLGMPKTVAGQKTQELMDSAFTCGNIEVVMDDEFQRDWHGSEANRWYDDTELKQQGSKK